MSSHQRPVADRPREHLARWAQRHAPFLGAAAVASLTLLVLGWLTFVDVPPVRLELRQESDGQWVVWDVPIAETAWLAGVKPGMTVLGSVPGGDGPPTNWETLFVTDGRIRIDVQRKPQPPDPIAFGVSVLALGVAFVTYATAPSLGSVLLAIPALTSLGAGSDFVPAPLALGLAVAPPTVAALFAAARPRRVHPLIPTAAVVAVVVVATAWLLAYVLRFESWAVPRQASVAITLGLLGIGTAGVVRQAVWRARARLGPGPAAGSLLAAVLDELAPGRARTQLAALERERAALADDLHAEVLPDLASVIRSVEAGLDPAEAAVRLRVIVDELRELMTERRLAVLDELGLLPALEWLAERIEERTTVRVELDIEGEGPTGVPREVELAAYRIAQQALDNALRHARPTLVRLELTSRSDGLELTISDDGVGISGDAEGRALRTGRLGMSDMRQRAAAIGAALTVGRRIKGGTTVALRWPA